MIVVIGGIKGGSGKTTIATNLCQMRAAVGKKVLLVDADEQRSSYDWSLQRDESKIPIDKRFVTVCLAGKSVYSNLCKLRPDYDDIIVDTGGRDTTSQRAAISCADKFLIPFKPRSIDIWTIGAVQRMLNECTNHNLKSYAFINQADCIGQDNEDSLEILKECSELESLTFFVGNRKAFGNAAANGLGVHESQPNDEKACLEIKKLYDFIYE